MKPYNFNNFKKKLYFYDTDREYNPTESIQYTLFRLLVRHATQSGTIGRYSVLSNKRYVYKDRYYFYAKI